MIDILPPRRILLIEDVDLMARIYGERLTAAGLIVDRARNGRDALGLCAAASYDLGLLDLTLPDMSGVEILDSLRSSAPQLPFPVIVFTNTDDPLEIDAAIRAGASKVIVKNTSTPDQVSAEVMNVLNQGT